MQIHEYQAKEILKAIGRESPPYQLIASLEELPEAMEVLGGAPLLVRAQVHGERVCRIGKSRDELVRLINEMLGMRVGERVVHRLLLMKPREEARRVRIDVLAEEDHPLKSYDVTEVELSLSQDDQVLDATMHIDDKALFRQDPRLRDFSQMSLIEAEAMSYGLSYTDRKGTIGVIASGMGLARKEAALIERFGGSVSGLVTLRGEDKEALSAAFYLLSRRSKALHVTLIPEIMNTEVWACWIAASLRQSSVRVVVRLLGEERAKARHLLLKYPQIKMIDDDEEAARAVVIAAGIYETC